MIIYFDGGRTPLMRDFFRESGVPFATLFRNANVKTLNTILLGKLQPKSLVYSTPKCEKDEPLIVFDTNATPKYFYWLCEYYPEKRIILWYWNPVNVPLRLRLMPRGVELWSYSQKDCTNYGMRYNTAFYFDSAAQMAEKEYERRKEINRQRKTTPRVLFIGREKGRKEKILEAGRLMEQNGAVCNFHFMQNGKGEKKKGLEKPMPYRQVLDLVKESDVLLDYYLDDCSGLSLRAMESLFWRKKLITNNRTIVDSDFYDPSNIYLLGMEDRTLREFFDEPYHDAPESVRSRYLLSNWLQRFEEADGE